MVDLGRVLKVVAEVSDKSSVSDSARNENKDDEVEKNRKVFEEMHQWLDWYPKYRTLFDAAKNVEWNAYESCEDVSGNGNENQNVEE